jgi:hypothetical protein
MFRRPFRRALIRPMVNTVPPALQRANRLMAEGSYAEASEIFEQFARGAMMRNGPRAPWFFIQAGQANILAGRVPHGMEEIQMGLKVFSDRGQVQQVNRVGTRVVNDLNNRGLKAEAGQIQALISQSTPANFVPGGMPERKPRALPTSCPGCGGPIRSNEVDWADEVTAECPYCGSSLRAE